jgi:hypothetical protein
MSIVLPFLVIAYIRLELAPEGNQSIGTILTRERQNETLRSLDFVVNNPGHKLYEKYRNRMNPGLACKKPKDSSAEDNSEDVILLAY